MAGRAGWVQTAPHRQRMTCSLSGATLGGTRCDRFAYPARVQLGIQAPGSSSRRRITEWSKLAGLPLPAAVVRSLSSRRQALPSTSPSSPSLPFSLVSSPNPPIFLLISPLAPSEITPQHDHSQEKKRRGGTRRPSLGRERGRGRVRTALPPYVTTLWRPVRLQFTGRYGRVAVATESASIAHLFRLVLVFNWHPAVLELRNHHADASVHRFEDDSEGSFHDDEDDDDEEDEEGEEEEDAEEVDPRKSIEIPLYHCSR
jgi:hypothetical protein